MSVSRKLMILVLALMICGAAWAMPALEEIHASEYRHSAQAVTLEMLQQAPGVLAMDSLFICFTAGFRDDLKPPTPSASLGVMAIEMFESRQRPLPAGVSLDYLWLVNGTTVWFADLRFLPQNLKGQKPHMIQKLANDAPRVFAQQVGSRIVLGVRNSAGHLHLVGSRM
jgi:hypothetical protein